MDPRKVLWISSIFLGLLVISLGNASLFEPWYCYLSTSYENSKSKEELICIYLYQNQDCNQDYCDTNTNDGDTFSVFIKVNYKITSLQIVTSTWVITIVALLLTATVIVLTIRKIKQSTLVILSGLSLLLFLLGWSVFFGITWATNEDQLAYAKPPFSGTNVEDVNINVTAYNGTSTTWGPVDGWNLDISAWTFSLCLFVLQIIIWKKFSNEITYSPIPGA